MIGVHLIVRVSLVVVGTHLYAAQSLYNTDLKQGQKGVINQKI